MYTVLLSSIFCCSAFGFFLYKVGIDMVSELTVRYVYTQFRLLERGLKMSVRLISTHASWSAVRIL